MMLAWLSGILCGSDRQTVRADLQQAGPAVSRYLREWKQHVESLATELAGVRSLFP
jgi:hypothetical protein